MRSLHEAGFRQKDYYTCGPASLALAAEAAGLGKVDESQWIDPKFSRWLNVADFPNRGISLQELLMAAEFTLGPRAAVSHHRAYPEAREKFRQDIEESVSGQAVIIINFTQDHLTGHEGWHGSPHFSPIAGYDPEGDRVYIADVDDEITEGYWASIDRVFEAMTFMNLDFQLPRGWLVIRPRD